MLLLSLQPHFPVIARQSVGVCGHAMPLRPAVTCGQPIRPTNCLFVSPHKGQLLGRVQTVVEMGRAARQREQFMHVSECFQPARTCLVTQCVGVQKKSRQLPAFSSQIKMRLSNCVALFCVHSLLQVHRFISHAQLCLTLTLIILGDFFCSLLFAPTTNVRQTV